MKIVFCNLVDVSELKNLYVDTPIVVPYLFDRDYIGHKILEYTNTGEQVIDYCYNMCIYDVCKELQRTYVNMPHS